jgi:replication initiation protein RepC
MTQRMPMAAHGGRSLTFAHMAAQKMADERPPEKAVHKWNLFRAICLGGRQLGVSERALSVLDALLSFHPETVLMGENLIVFPSNEQLSLRAKGMPHATLRRHLAALVDARLIVRRDSPNGKRFARKGRDGEIETAFGFDLGPLVARAEEIEAVADEVRAEQLGLRLAREKITLCRRDVARLIETGVDEGVRIGLDSGLPSDWVEVHALFRSIVARIPRNAPRGVLEGLADELASLATQIAQVFDKRVESEILSVNESQNERHKQNSNPNPLPDFEPSLREGRGGAPEPLVERPGAPKRKRQSEGAYPLRMVLEACPDLIDYAKGGISSWRDFIATANVVRPLIGISPSAWEDAQSAMGEVYAAIVLGCILQKGEAINSAGGYLRELSRKAEAGEFSVGPMLMALLSARSRKRTA